MITIDFNKINEEDWSTEHLIYWNIENPDRTVFPRKYELIMLPENSSDNAKRCKYEIRNILRLSFNELIYYVRQCDDLDLYIKDEVSSGSDKNNSDKNARRI